jgi:hypothetical protein
MRLDRRFLQTGAAYSLGTDLGPVEIRFGTSGCGGKLLDASRSLELAIAYLLTIQDPCKTLFYHKTTLKLIRT